ncbi:MAG TPA: class I SAM-dependent methyltransferase, partial [Allosphingosinicella sp.]|nr:class I SAM-dependent methyltransferase [Allosphingosinicella sp.]
MTNLDPATARGFDDNWGAVRLRPADPADVRRSFDAFFSLFPLEELGSAEGFDLGCGFGHRAASIAPLVGKLHCVDPSPKGIETARRLMAGRGNVRFHVAGVDSIPLADSSQDFGYSIGVLHHVPDTEEALRSCVAKLKRRAPFLLYLYYALDDRPLWYRALWRASNGMRRIVSRLPFGARKALSGAIGLLVYYPLSRAALLLERGRVPIGNFP